MTQSATFSGVVRGNTVILDRDPGLVDGEKVVVVIEPSSQPSRTADEMKSSLEKAFGGWADEGEDLDAYLEWNRQQRKIDRRELEP